MVPVKTLRRPMESARQAQPYLPHPAMKHIDAQNDLQDGIDPAPMPPIGPDGAPQIPELRPEVPPCPSLCQAGPCRNYHRFVTQTDNANPMARLVPIRLPAGTPGASETPQGTLYQAPAVYYTETHHYCYPTQGVEMNLGALPVLECNRWGLAPGHPKTEDHVLAVYLEKARAWTAARLAESEQDTQIEQLIAEAANAAKETT